MKSWNNRILKARHFFIFGSWFLNQTRYLWLSLFQLSLPSGPIEDVWIKIASTVQPTSTSASLITVSTIMAMLTQKNCGYWNTPTKTNQKKKLWPLTLMQRSKWSCGTFDSMFGSAVRVFKINSTISKSIMIHNDFVWFLIFKINCCF